MGQLISDGKEALWVANDLTMLAGWLGGSRGHHVNLVC